MNNIALYCISQPPSVIKWTLNHLPNLKFNDNQIFWTREEFVNSNFKKKISLIFLPYRLTPDAYYETITDLLSISDLVIVLTNEINKEVIAFIKMLNDPRVHYHLGGRLNFNVNNSLVADWWNWFHTSSFFYKEVKPELLDKIHPYTTKELCFDILLGCQRGHRDFIYDSVNNSELKNQVCMTYYRYANKNLRDTGSDFLWEDEGIEFKPGQTPSHTVDMVKYYNNDIHISQIIPINIYNKTAYSVIAETHADNDFSFFTEKTVKPMLAKRLFIAFSGQHFLRNLRGIGFKTFDGIIDESYDSIEDGVTRFQQAFKQMEYLATLDQQTVFEKIKPIVEHNYQLVMTRNFYREFLENLESSIQTVLV